MDRYEYRTLETQIAKVAEKEFEARLNALGQEGWNLVTAVSHERHGYSHEVVFMFSRRLAA